MTQYREYRGLFGEPVRVPERTIAPNDGHHGRGPFPFAAIAARLGKDRDKFANLALRLKWIEDARRSPQYRSATLQLGLAQPAI